MKKNYSNYKMKMMKAWELKEHVRFQSMVRHFVIRAKYLAKTFNKIQGLALLVEEFLNYSGDAMLEYSKTKYSTFTWTDDPSSFVRFTTKRYNFLVSRMAQSYGISTDKINRLIFVVFIENVHKDKDFEVFIMPRRKKVEDIVEIFLNN